MGAKALPRRLGNHVKSRAEALLTTCGKPQSVSRSYSFVSKASPMTLLIEKNLKSPVFNGNEMKVVWWRVGQG